MNSDHVAAEMVGYGKGLFLHLRHFNDFLAMFVTPEKEQNEIDTGKGKY
jgi:hypothetical protein